MHPPRSRQYLHLCWSALLGNTLILYDFFLSSVFFFKFLPMHIFLTKFRLLLQLCHRWVPAECWMRTWCQNLNTVQTSQWWYKNLTFLFYFKQFNLLSNHFIQSYIFSYIPFGCIPVVTVIITNRKKKKTKTKTKNKLPKTQTHHSPWLFLFFVLFISGNK